MVRLDRPCGVDEIHAVAQQGHDPTDHGGGKCDRGHTQPAPATPARQSPRHHPVLEHDAGQQPEHAGHARGEQERERGHALVVGGGRGEPPREIAIRFRAVGPRSGPGAYGQRLAAGGCRGHRAAWGYFLIISAFRGDGLARPLVSWRRSATPTAARGPLHVAPARRRHVQTPRRWLHARPRPGGDPGRVVRHLRALPRHRRRPQCSLRPRPGHGSPRIGAGDLGRQPHARRHRQDAARGLGGPHAPGCRAPTGDRESRLRRPPRRGERRGGRTGGRRAGHSACRRPRPRGGRPRRSRPGRHRRRARRRLPAPPPRPRPRHRRDRRHRSVRRRPIVSTRPAPRASHVAPTGPGRRAHPLIVRVDRATR